MPDRTVTLAEYLVGRVGLMKGTKVAAFVVAWGFYMEAEPGPYTLEGYTAFWEQSISTTYRERDLFQICWPEEKLPTEVWLRLRAQMEGTSWRGQRRDEVAARALSLAAVL